MADTNETITTTANNVVDLDLDDNFDNTEIDIEVGVPSTIVGAEAKINGYNTVTIKAEDGITLTQANEVLTLTSPDIKNKLDKNAEITAGTHTKITYDKNGLVTSGSDLEATDIPTIPQSKVDGLETRLTTDEGNITANTTAITNEATTRASADTTLQTNIDTVSASVTTEATTRASADTALGERIDTTNTNLASETTNRETADATLQTNINNEASTRTSADNALGERIDTTNTEVSRINTALSEEVTTRTSEVATLTGNVSTLTTNLATETTNRIAGDNTLQSSISTVSTNLSTEITQRKAVDETVQGQISTLTSDLSTETSNRTAADTALNTRVDFTITGLTKEVNDRTLEDAKIREEMETIRQRKGVKFITADASGNNFATYASLASGPYYYLGNVATLSKDDYALVEQDETHESKSTRYMYVDETEGWKYQYVVEGVVLTPARVAALDSTITKAKVDSYDSHIADTENPHAVSKSQVGLGNVPNVDATNASNISSGTLNNDRLSNIPVSKLASVTATASELNILDGATLTTTELNYVDGVTSNIQTQLNNKVEKNNDITGATHSKITYDAKGLVTGGSDLALTDLGVTATASELNVLDGITASTSELNILDGATLTTTELNYVDGVSSNIQTQLNGKLTTADIYNKTDSTATDKALSANMGKELQDEINNLKSIGRYLSNWNCATGLPTTDPTTSPYTYKTGDYYFISTIASGTNKNYKPSGSSYTKGVASTVEETETVAINDYYVYDGNVWKLLQNTQRTVTFANIAGEPTDNTKLASALNAKQNEITSSAKLSADLVDDTSTTHKFVTADDKTNWNGKVTANDAITGATHSKITYDSKGLVTSGSDLTLSDFNITATATEINVLDGITASTSELNVLDGITATTTELNYVDGVTSNIQTQLNGKAVYPDQSGNNGKFLTTNGTATSWATVDALPAQSGQSGKFLTTNGSSASWANVDALPSQSGHNGHYLKTNGTTASWAALDVPEKISDLTDDTATNPIAKANTLTGLTASITELNYTDGVTSSIQTQIDNKSVVKFIDYTD